MAFSPRQSKLNFQQIIKFYYVQKGTISQKIPTFTGNELRSIYLHIQGVCM